MIQKQPKKEFNPLNKIVQTGFTLIELLVVIAIIGILATVVLVNLSASKSKGRDARRLEDMHQISNALESYLGDCGQYPPTMDPAEATGCTDGTTFGSYIGTTPTDPDGTAYVYVYDAANDTYTVTFTLENPTGDFASGAHTMEPDGIH